MPRILLLLLALTPLLAAGELDSERIWTGRNGKSFRGILVRILDDSSGVEIAAPGNKIYTIALENLADPDRALVKAEIARRQRIAGEKERRERRPKPDHPERDWTVKGKDPIRGAYLETVSGGDGIKIRVPGGSTLTLPARDLGEADLKWIRELDSDKLSEAEEDRRNGVGAFTGFQPDPGFDRSLIPLVDPEETGVRMRWGTGSVCSFILWWDQMGWIEVPRGRDFTAKAEWLNKRLGRKTDGNTSVASIEEIMKGYADYFDSRFEDEATFNCYLEYDLNPVRLAQLASGPNACLLRAGAGGYGPYFALLEASPDGAVRLGLAGKSIDAIVSPVGEGRHYGRSYQVPLPGGGTYPHHERHGRPPQNLSSYRLTVRDRSLLPEEFRDPEHEITISPATPMVVFRPYLYLKPGEKLPPPGDPLFKLDQRP